MHGKYGWIPAHNEMVANLSKESDRAAALLAASFLETEMQRRLLDFFVEDASSQRLFDSYSPLATFAGRTDMAFALGFLTRSMKCDLTWIRKIRNHFAHHPKHVTFTDPPVSDWCRELSTAKGIPAADGSLFCERGPRSQYLLAITITLTYFDRFVGAVPRRLIPDHPLPR